MNKLHHQIDFFEIAKLLKAELGNPELLHRTSPLAYCNNPLEVLIAAILTQATSDRNAIQAWHKFKKNFPEPELALVVDEKVLIETLHSAGLAVQKTRTIREVLKTIKKHLGVYSLEPLARDPSKVWLFLNQLPGVGPKSAACTMLFGFGFPSFPIDVHINRIIKRLGWITEKVSLSEAQQFLETIIPMELQKELHILLLNLGRKYCRPKLPRCDSCPLQTICSKSL